MTEYAHLPAGPHQGLNERDRDRPCPDHAGGSAGGGDIWLDLRQDGAKVTGELRITGTALRRDGPIEGRVSGNSFTFARVGTATSTTGGLSVSGDSMNGTVFGNVDLRANLRRDSP